MTVSVVVPLYNEQENVELLHQKLTEVLSRHGAEYEVIYVDDGSTDSTLELLEGIKKGDRNVVVLSLRRNFGQAAAFAAGFDFARGSIVVTMDGDLQNDPNDIPRMLEAIKDYDLVSGWRKYRKDPLIMRRIPSIAANWLISKVTGVRLHDYGCSLKAYRRDVVKNLKLYGEMHRFIPAVASWYGVRISEIIIAHHPRFKGRSKYGIYKTVKVLLDLITVKFLQSFSTKPIQFFGPIGGLFSFAGICISAYLTIQKLFFGIDIGGRPLLLLGALLIIVGVQFIGMGLLGEMLVRVYHESQKKPIYTIKKMLGPSE
ncbi:MAG: glycosyltransferase family 2 protein [Dissulfurispiraceae bacterium]|jgi:glycosyltransferase involved in cell wall biosynthesis|nr:glycosyltransferase family 2 protein [Dissulfurispiraceae bacterium]